MKAEDVIEVIPGVISEAIPKVTYPEPPKKVFTGKTWCVSDMCFVRERGIEENPFDESDSGKERIRTKIGDKLYFSFNENPTTGFRIIVDNTTINGFFNYTQSFTTP